MRLPWSAASPLGRRLARNRGGAALEFLLVMPVLLLIMIGMLVLGNYLMVRYHLTSAATHAARTCVVGATPNLACARAAAISILPRNVQGRCPSLGVRAHQTNLPGTGVNVFNVTLTCAYDPAIGRRFLADEAVTFGSLQVSGAMPIQQ